MIDIVKVFFDDYDKKIRYLEYLYNNGQREEARILCPCYIDSMASALYWPEERNNFNYVRILKEHSDKEIFSYIHLKMLDQELHRLASRSKKWVAIYSKVSHGLQRSLGRLYSDRKP